MLGLIRQIRAIRGKLNRKFPACGPRRRDQGKSSLVKVNQA
jgi:hypothetical protein